MKNARGTWRVEGNCYRLSDRQQLKFRTTVNNRCSSANVEPVLLRKRGSKGLVDPIPIAQVIWKRGGEEVTRFCGSFDVIFPRGINGKS